MMPRVRKRVGGVSWQLNKAGTIPTPQPMAALQSPRDICLTLGHAATVPAAAVLPAIVSAQEHVLAVYEAPCGQEEVAIGRGNPSARADLE